MVALVIDTLETKETVAAWKAGLGWTIPVLLDADAPASWQAAYPAADPWRIAEDEEPLLTYLGRVQVVVTVRIPAGARQGDLAFHGSIRYQACNERWCFPPASIPVAFLVRVGAE